MKNHSRFFVEEKIGSEENFVLKDKAQIRQISRVLRLKTGSDVVLLDGSGFEYVAIIESFADDEIILKIFEKRESAAEPKIKFALYQSLLKKDKMEWIFEKGTELGVSRFVPILSEHCVKTDLNFARAEKIIREAAEQCGRPKLPEISEILGFQKAVEFSAKEGGLNLIFNKGEAILFKNFACRKELPERINPHASGGVRVNIFVGPEGGFSEDEIALARNSGFQAVSLGARTLRAETAAIAACALLVD